MKIQDFNKSVPSTFQLKNSLDQCCSSSEQLQTALREIIPQLEEGLLDIVAIDLSSLNDDAIAQEIESILRPYTNGLFEVRTSSETENTVWHIHATREQHKDVLYWKENAITFNCALEGKSTLFTSTNNIQFSDIDIDPDLETSPNDCSIGNFENAQIMHDEYIYSPPTKHLMLFRDNVVHKAPEQDEKRRYIIGRNINFTQFMDRTTPSISGIPEELLPQQNN